MDRDQRTIASYSSLIAADTLKEAQNYSMYYTYRKVASSSLSRLVAPFQIFRRLMKGKFDAYVL